MLLSLLLRYGDEFKADAWSEAFSMRDEDKGMHAKFLSRSIKERQDMMGM
jgi:hypothetical protein